MDYAQSVSTREFQTIPLAWSWRGVLRGAAVAQLVLLVFTLVTLRDLLSAGLAVILLMGLTLWMLRGKLSGFLFRKSARVARWRGAEERLGALILGFLFADIGFYTLTGALSNLMNGIYGAAIYLPASLAAVSLVGFVAAVVCVVNPIYSVTSKHGTVNFVMGVGLVWFVVMGVGLLGGPRAARVLPPSDVKLVTENMAYSQTALKAQAGHVVVELENHDLFWHTFTIPELNVDMKVPVEATQQISFEAPAGTYRFHCTIPGHELLGMEGTLVVK